MFPGVMSIKDRVWSLVSGMIFRVGQSSATPTATEHMRGGLLFVPGGTGVSDRLQFCRKDSSDVVGWTPFPQVGDEFDDATFTIHDDADPTKKFKLQLSSIGAGATRTATVPNGNFTFATTTLTQTFTNKTLTSPVINTGDINNPDLDGGTIDGAVITVVDSSLLITGSSDATKVAKFEADGITTATTRTYTLPDISGTVALAPTVTVRSTTGASIANGAFQSVSQACNSDEVCTGGGFTAVTSTLVRVSNNTSSGSNGWTLAWTNVSGANAQMSVQAICAKFGA